MLLNHYIDHEKCEVSGELHHTKNMVYHNDSGCWIHVSKIKDFVDSQRRDCSAAEIESIEKELTDQLKNK